jgi:folate-binding Fe-S cluster repair protein YgfZ
MVLSWFEHRAEDEVPPEHLWDDGEGLDQWWKEVDARKGIDRSTGDDDEEIPEQVGNDLAAAFKD